MLRPKCRRCGGSLDFWHDSEYGEIVWCCNNPKPAMTDEEFFKDWENLSGDDVVRLERLLEEEQ